MFAQVSRFKVVSFVLVLMACVVMWPASITEANAKEKANISVAFSCYNTGDLELYNIGAYESIYVSDEYVNLWKMLIKEGRLVQASTTIRCFKGSNGKLLISHELIAKPSRIMGNYKAPEYITFMTDYQDAAEKFCKNAIEELGFKVRGAYGLNWCGKEVHLVALER